MFTWIRVVILAASFMGASLASQAEQPPIPATLQVYCEPRPPFSYLQPDGQVGGLGTVLVRAILEQAGFKGQFQLLPWARAVHMTLSHPNALIYDIVRSKQREHQYVWIGTPLLPPTEEWLYRQIGNESIAPRSVAEVRASYSVCVLRNNITEEILLNDGFEPGKNLIEADSLNDCIQLVKTHALSLLADVRFFRDPGADSKIHPGMEAILMLPADSDQQIHAYLAANRDSSPQIIDRLQKAFKQLQASGQLEQTLRQFEQDYIHSHN